MARLNIRIDLTEHLVDLLLVVDTVRLERGLKRKASLNRMKPESKMAQGWGRTATHYTRRGPVDRDETEDILDDIDSMRRSRHINDR